MAVTIDEQAKTSRERATVLRYTCIARLLYPKLAFSFLATLLIFGFRDFARCAR
jgi:hypothetical protein